MKVSDFDFQLPEELIALRPAAPRDSARLLVVRGREGRLEDRKVSDLPDLLGPGDMLVLNDTRVLRAALSGVRPARGPGGNHVPVEVNLNSQRPDGAWSAFARPGRRLHEGDIIAFQHGLEGRVVAKCEEGEIVLAFNRSGPELYAALEVAGAMPLPPYIASRRLADRQDADDYQTVFARAPGSSAAPTAGLHFTPNLFAALEAAGIARATVTLHVNGGTFLPVKSEDTAGHRMHEEYADLPSSTAHRIEAHRKTGGRCIPVGTTSLRTLESAAAAGAFERGFQAGTSIFITPGYRFRIADGLITNFHLPRSTLFMLVSAMMGLDTMKGAYAHAVRERYRFFSYGDACLLLPSREGGDG